MSYRLNHSAIRELAREWGIAEPLRVRRVKRRWDPRTGFYSMRADLDGDHTFWALGERAEHRIRLDGGNTPQRVAYVLAHELGHARIASRYWREQGPGSYAAAARAERHIPYEDRPMEHEADAWARDHADEVLDRCMTITEAA